jgi:hypothetical protein
MIKFNLLIPYTFSVVFTNDLREPPTDFGKTPQFDYSQIIQFSRRLPSAVGGSV